MPNVDIDRSRWLDPVGRDGCRTPMQWNDTPGGGFTNSERPWLPLGDCSAASVAGQMNDPHSMLSFYRRAIRVRRASPALSAGSLRVIDTAPGDCLVFLRETSGDRAMVALNFTDEFREIEIIGKNHAQQRLRARPCVREGRKTPALTQRSCRHPKLRRSCPARFAPRARTGGSVKHFGGLVIPGMRSPL